LVRNTYELYNFIGNNYLRKIICQLRFLEKIVEKSHFLQIFLTNFARKILYNMRIFSSENKNIHIHFKE